MDGADPAPVAAELLRLLEEIETLEEQVARLRAEFIVDEIAALADQVRVQAATAGYFPLREWADSLAAAADDVDMGAIAERLGEFSECLGGGLRREADAAA